MTAPAWFFLASQLLVGFLSGVVGYHYGVTRLSKRILLRTLERYGRDSYEGMKNQAINTNTVGKA